MPDLEITPENQKDFFSRAMFLARVEVLMLWPDDKVKRSEYMSHVEPHAFLEAHRLDLEATRGVKWKTWMSQLEKAIDAPSKIEMLNSSEKRQKPGKTIGNMLLNMLGNFHVTGSKDSLRMALDESRSSIMPQVGLDYAYTDLWPKYQSVAHLWSAHILLTKWTDNLSSNVPEEPPFPFHQSQIMQFQAFSEAVLKMASA